MLAEEIAELKKEALALKALKDCLGMDDHFKVVFEKVCSLFNQVGLYEWYSQIIENRWFMEI